MVTKALIYAEYVALSEAVSEVKFVLELMKNFNVKLSDRARGAKKHMYSHIL